MEIVATALNGVLVLKPRVIEDRRGFFLESYSAKTLQSFGIHAPFVQDNHSRSVRGTVRGLHYQSAPGQGKLLRVVTGRIFDVAVDIRHGSPTFGQWYGHELSADNFLQLYVPVGFAHGFCVLSEQADLLYKCTSFYDPQTERGLAWDDPAIGVAWPVDDPILSDRDLAQPRLDAIARDFVYGEAA
jgi:dTDP-4-dehydrorhamnose 3,5-epimerase